MSEYVSYRNTNDENVNLDRFSFLSESFLKKVLIIFTFFLSFLYAVRYGILGATYIAVPSFLVFVMNLLTVNFKGERRSSVAGITVNLGILLSTFVLSSFIHNGLRYFAMNYVSLLLYYLILFDSIKKIKIRFFMTVLTVVVYTVQFFWNPADFLHISKIEDSSFLKYNILFGTALLGIQILYFLQKTDSEKKNENKENLKTKTDNLLALAKVSADDFDVAFSAQHPDFRRILLSKAPDMTQAEYEICCYSKLLFSSKEIAQMTGLSVKAVESRKFRARKKLHLSDDKEFVFFLFSL